MFTNQEVVYDPKFEPDSCKEAWEHYRKYYFEPNIIRTNYDFDKLFLYNGYKKVNLIKGYYDKDTKEWYNYTNKITDSFANRYYALLKNTSRQEKDGIEYCPAASRVGGDCDFNFNDIKYKQFKKIIGDNQTAHQQLIRCKEKHHTLLNFSLMQAMGNMQGFKGEGYNKDKLDRLDKFIYELDQYFRGESENILSKSTSSNKEDLVDYLSNFNDIYEYCKEVYFIEKEELVNEIIKNGKKPIETCEDVIRYMNLAEKFWAAKEAYFLKKDFFEKAFLTIDGYFNNGGETYTLEELLIKLENDLGCAQDEAKILIEKCVDRGFITACGNDIYVR